MTGFDGRRKQYVPLDVFVAFKGFGLKLNDKWQMEGICAWMLFLAACKRSHVQGEFTYTSDEECWSKLGAVAAGFTPDEFFRWTGTQKKTSRTRSGRVRYVKCLQWDDWNTPRPSRQKPSKPDENTTVLPENARTLLENARYEQEAEAEHEVEGEAEPALVALALPKSAEIETAVEKMLNHCVKTERNSRSVLAHYANQLPFPVVAQIAEGVVKSRPRVGPGWAVNAMKAEIAERNAA